jgi:hypothetical protein
MVTLRRGPNTLSCVIWGNADGALRAAWHTVVWACAAAGPGQIDSPNGPVTAEQFGTTTGITPT